MGTGWIHQPPSPALVGARGTGQADPMSLAGPRQYRPNPDNDPRAFAGVMQGEGNRGGQMLANPYDDGATPIGARPGLNPQIGPSSGMPVTVSMLGGQAAPELMGLAGASASALIAAGRPPNPLSVPTPDVMQLMVGGARPSGLSRAGNPIGSPFGAPSVEPTKKATAVLQALQRNQPN